MKVRINKGIAQGAVSAPPSKSYAHRLLICAALAKGETVVQGAALSQDILATLDCLKGLGADYRIEGDCITVVGCGGKTNPYPVLPCRESGSTLRFFIPVALLAGGCARFSGTQRLISRGIGVYERLLGERGIEFAVGQTDLTAKGVLASGHYQILGNVSSQFVSGMLFALPLAAESSVLEVLPPVESRDYINITVDAVRRFGIALDEPKPNLFLIPGSQTYQPGRHRVEGDWSNAAFLFALNCFGGEVAVDGLNQESIQGDRVCLTLLERLSSGKGEIDLSDCPDLAPVLFAVAAAKHGAVFTGTRRLAIKESDRAAVMAEELAKFGVTVEVGENSVVVGSGGIHAPSETLCGHNDHRIVMALSVLCTLTGGAIEGAQAVAKSYPDFFDTLKRLGLEVEYET